MNRIDRRTLLATLGIGAAAVSLNDVLLPALANADETGDPPLLVFAYFEGGWDTLLGLDPRSEKEYGNGKDIQTAYEKLSQGDAALQAALQETGGTGVYKPTGSNIEFGPCIGELSDHFADLCVVRGVNMGTLTHEVGRRYFLTGKFPRGLQASGSALPTYVVHNTADQSILPNLVVGTETYNEGLNPASTGVVIQGAEDLFYLMNRIESELPPAASKAMAEYLDGTSCLQEQLDSSGLVNLYRVSRSKSDQLASGKLFEHFDFDADSAEIKAVREHFGYDEASGVDARALEQAMIAAQALEHGISQAVSISLANNIDHHDDTYQTDHAPALRAGFNAAARLISFLKNKSLWQRTVIVLWSEFGRTPRINGRGGRDHNLSGACAIGGMGIAGNRVIGGTDKKYNARPVDLATGDADDNGVAIRPADIHATMLKAMGLTYDHISNQDPKIITSMLS